MHVQIAVYVLKQSNNTMHIYIYIEILNHLCLDVCMQPVKLHFQNIHHLEITYIDIVLRLLHTYQHIKLIVA